MEPAELQILISLNEIWFRKKFENVLKNYIKNEEMIHLICCDLLGTIKEANEQLG